jgi:hypothetical protein
MPETDKRFWQMFEEKLFSETFGMFSEEWLDDFWLKTPIRNSSSSFSSDDNEPETEEERAVHIFNHPHVIPFLELRKNVIVAVCPNEQWFLDNPDEPRENFWLAKILSHHYSQKGTQQQHRYRVQWFANRTNHTPERPALYHLIENTQIINYGAILHHNIELNLKKSLYAKDLRIIQSRI